MTATYRSRRLLKSIAKLKWPASVPKLANKINRME
jgi:hypothetical protein